MSWNFLRMDVISGSLASSAIFNVWKAKPLFALDIPISEYAIFSIKRFALFSAKIAIFVFRIMIRLQ